MENYIVHYIYQKEKTMRDPRLEDDIALGLDEEEELDDGYQEPDRMWGDE
jgi:hypothetical protein